jgi:hypothetical protein
MYDTPNNPLVHLGELLAELGKRLPSLPPLPFTHVSNEQSPLFKGVKAPTAPPPQPAEPEDASSSRPPELIYE